MRRATPVFRISAKSTRCLRPIALTLAAILACSRLEARPAPASIFTDHMVLQRERPVRVWGTADPSEAVTVTMSSGVAVHTAADSSGQWHLDLPPMQAGGPFDLTIVGQRDSTVLRDVMIGDVWLLSGQSNMSFEVSRASNAEEAIKSADRPDVHLITIPKRDSLQIQQDFHAGWVQCTPASAQGFSAVGYFFGTALAERLHVPIGLVLSSWPGTQAEEWTPAARLAGTPELAPILSRWQQAPESVKDAANGGFPLSMELSDIELVRKDGTTEPASEFSQTSIRSPFGGAWTYTWDSAPFTTWKLQKSMAGAFTSVVTGRLRDEDGSTLHLALRRGGAPMDLSAYSGVRFRMRGYGFFQFQANEPAVKDGSDYSSAVLKPGPAWTPMDLPFSAFKQPEWGVQKPWTANAITGFQLVALTGDSEYGQRPPSGLFNGMIAPLAPFALRGVLWYQGEGNAGRAYQYRTLLPSMIAGWREAWADPQLPFVVVQLPRYGPVKTDPSESAWAELREAQAIAARGPHIALVTTIDLGEPENVHPANKVEVGRRAALVAEASVYGQNVTASGPVFDGIQLQGNSIVVHLSHRTGALRSTDRDSLRGFAVAGQDRHFLNASARIQEDSIVVSSPAVPNPAAVRYDWADSPDGNLTDASGLPAAPFRSDDYPGTTIGHN